MGPRMVENSLRILDLCRTPETDSTSPWCSIEPRLRTTVLKSSLENILPFPWSVSLAFVILSPSVPHHSVHVSISGQPWLVPAHAEWARL